MTLLRAEGLAVTLPGRGGDRPVIRGLDLRLEGGELRGVVGPSGGGKTTLLRALAGLAPIHAGRVTLDGEPMERVSPARWRRRVGMVPQRPVMVAGTVRDNVELASTLGTAPLAHDWGRSPEELLEAVGIAADRLDDPAAELSEGQTHRVALARSILAGPRVLLLDEPTAALDPGTADRVEALLRELVDEGLAALWVLHDAQRTEDLPAPPLLVGSAVDGRGDGA